MNRAAALLLWALAAAARAEDGYPPIREIAFAGNHTTRPKVMLREMVIKVGDPADPALIERSRQGVQDLGLFRSVGVEQQPVEGGVRLLFSVKEKLYVLPLPRADASSDGGYGYGFQLRWNNVWGLNHNFTSYFERRQPSEGSGDPEKRGVQTRTQLRYSAPFLFDSPYGLTVALGYFGTPYVEPLAYDETVQFVSLGLGRKVQDQPGSQGWSVGAGLNWRDQSVEGPDAAVVNDEGQATSLFVGASYRDMRYNIYSDEGVTYSFGAESAGRDWGSDYQFTSWSAGYARYRPFGDTQHQTFNLIANVASRHGGAPGAQEAFSIGGADSLRGFEPETAKGDFYYRLSGEYLRPVFRKSIRVLAVVDAGNAFARPGDLNFDKVFVSAGIGARVRIQAFVSLDLELGIAWPLNGGGPRLFASKV